MDSSALQFHLTFGDVVSTQWGIFLASAVLGLAVVIGGVTVSLRNRKYRQRVNIGIVLILVGIISLFMAPVIVCSTEVGAGWSYSTTSGILAVDTTTGHLNIPMQGAEVDEVDTTHGYALKGKIVGTNMRNFNAGRFHLANGTRAYVFQYGANHNWLLIKTQGVVLLLSSPHIHQLETALHLTSSPLTPPSKDTGVQPSSPQSMLLYVALQVLLTLVAVWLQFVNGHRYHARLPKKMATHFNFAGEADNWMSKESALHIGPITAASLGLLFTCLSLAGSPLGVILLCLGVFVQLVMLIAINFMLRANIKRT